MEFVFPQAFCGEAMFIVASILHLGKSGLPKKVSDVTTTILLPRLPHLVLLWRPQPITEDDAERLGMCLRVLAERNELLTHVFGEASREALSRLLLTRDAETKKKVSILSGYSQYTRVNSG